MKYLKLFETEENMVADINTAEFPLVCYVEETDKVYYMKEPYIQFADPLIKEVVVANWGGVSENYPDSKEGEITYKQAAAVTSLGTAFSSSTNLASFTSFDELKYFVGLTTIGGFSGASALTSIIIPYNVTQIGGSAFKNCTSLNNVKLSNKIKTLAGDSFLGCTALQHITLPESLTTFGAAVFSKSGITEITIPSGVKNIPTSLFQTCTSLTTFVWEGSGIVDQRAFDGCSNLENIDWSYFTSIAAYSFQNCTSLHDLILPEGQKSIPDCYYKSYGIKTVVFPSTATYINTLFRGGGTTYSVICKASTPPTLGVANAKANPIYVPDESVAAYQAADKWSTLNIVGKSQLPAELQEYWPD